MRPIALDLLSAPHLGRTLRAGDFADSCAMSGGRLCYIQRHKWESGPVGYLFQCALILLYHVPAELLTGRTPGKIITRTRVVSRTGGPPTAKQIVGRTLLRLVPLEAFTFLARRRPGLHDWASGTRVVMTRNT